MQRTLEGSKQTSGVPLEVPGGDLDQLVQARHVGLVPVEDGGQQVLDQRDLLHSPAPAQPDKN